MPAEHDPRRIQEKLDAGLTLEQAVIVLDREAAAATGASQDQSICHRGNEAPAAAGRKARVTGRTERKTRDKRPNPKPNKGDTKP